MLHVDVEALNAAEFWDSNEVDSEDVHAAVELEYRFLALLEEKG